MAILILYFAKVAYTFTFRGLSNYSASELDPDYISKKFPY